MTGYRYKSVKNLNKSVKVRGYTFHGVLRKSCNDYVGDAARLVAEALG